MEILLVDVVVDVIGELLLLPKEIKLVAATPMIPILAPAEPAGLPAAGSCLYMISI